MAEVLIWNIQFISNNPNGTFVTGDELSIYYDQDLQPVPSNGSIVPFVVRHNGMVIGSGPGLPNVFGQNGIYTSQFYNYQVCIGGSLVLPIPPLIVNFPYLFTYVQENHQDCAVTPVVCNLAIVGTPVTVGATDSVTADGQITLTATSIAGIEYKLGSDFIYGDGSAQSTGTFTGLFPGEYRIFIRDSNQCSVNTLVTVGINNTYSPIARLEYIDLSGLPTKIEIKKRAYSGSVDELICGTIEPFELLLRGESGIDKFVPVISTEAKLNFNSLTDGQWHYLFTEYPNELQVVYSKNLGAGYTEKWTGFIIPNQFQEAFMHVPYPVSVSATDNLTLLKDIFLSDDSGNRFYGKQKTIELIAFCLKKTGLSLPIRVGINMYSSSMDQTSSDDPLDQAYIDFDALYIAKDSPTLDFVLSALIEPYGAQLILFNNRWNIIRVEETNSSYDWREFDSDGAYSSNGSTDPIIEVDNPILSNRLALINNDHNLELIPGYGNTFVRYNLGLKENILLNGDFSLKATYFPQSGITALAIDKRGFTINSIAYAITEGVEAIGDDNVALTITGGTDTDGSAYIVTDDYSFKMGANNTLRIRIRVKVDNIWNGLNYVSVPYQKIRMRITYGPHYLKADGTWNTTGHIIKFYATEFGKYVDYEIVAIQPDASVSTTEEDFTLLLYHVDPFHTDYSTVTGAFTTLKAATTTTLPLGSRTEVRDSSVAYSNRIRYYQLVNSTAAESLPELVRPNDYHAITNPVQWEQVASIFPVITNDTTYKTSIDKIEVAYLSNGDRLTDNILLKKIGQPKNKKTYVKDVYFGSYKEQFVTLPEFSIGGGIVGIGGSGAGGLSLINVSSLASNITYSGWLRLSDDTPIITWKRDSVAEGKTLQEILLSQIASQYNRTIRKLTGSMSGINGGGVFAEFISTFKIVSDSNRLYRPISMTIFDRSASYNVELIELVNTEEETGAPFSSAFTTGFGDSGFN